MGTVLAWDSKSNTIPVPMLHPTAVLLPLSLLLSLTHTLPHTVSQPHQPPSCPWHLTLTISLPLMPSLTCTLPHAISLLPCLAHTFSCPMLSHTLPLDPHAL